MDDTWLHYNISKTIEQTKQWLYMGECVPKKAKVYLSASKVMATIFLGIKDLEITDSWAGVGKL